MDDSRYDHLARLTTATGLYEHAQGTEPRVEHGMCVDDVARALVVTCREAEPTPELLSMSRTYLTFLLRRAGGRRPDAQPERRCGPVAR